MTALTRAAARELGVEVSVLRCLSDAPPNAAGLREQFYDLDVHGGDGGRDWSPPAPAQWLTAAALDAATLARPSQRPLLTSWFEERRRAPDPPDGRDWIRPGWRDQVSDWLNRELARRGRGTVGRIEQVRVWEFCHVLRLQAGQAELYLKALAAAGAVELAVTRRLAELYPTVMPAIVAVEPERRWLLMDASPGPALMGLSDVARWEQAASALARLQIDCADRIPELRALGCPERPLGRLETEIEALLHDTGAMMPGDAESLTAGEVQRLRSRRDELLAWCHELADHGVPSSIEHGDLWGENVLVGERECVFIDWEDACLSHPFFSAYLLLLSLDHTDALAGVPDARGRIRRAYLAPWREAGPLADWPSDRIDRAFDVAQRLAALHYAVQFRAGLSRIETSWEVRGFIPLFLRKLLSSGALED